MGWCTPIIWKESVRPELVVSSQLGVWSHEPRTGQELMSNNLEAPLLFADSPEKPTIALVRPACTAVHVPQAVEN